MIAHLPSTFGSQGLQKRCWIMVAGHYHLTNSVLCSHSFSDGSLSFPWTRPCELQSTVLWQLPKPRKAPLQGRVVAKPLQVTCAFVPFPSSPSPSVPFLKQQAGKVIGTLVGLGLSIGLTVALTKFRVLLLLPLSALVGFIAYARVNWATLDGLPRSLLNFLVASSDKVLSSFIAFLQSIAKRVELFHKEDAFYSLGHRFKHDEIDFALVDIKKGLDRLENAIGRDNGSLTHNKAGLKELKEALALLKVLTSDYVASNSGKGHSSSQFFGAVRDLGVRASNVVQIGYPLHEAQGKHDLEKKTQTNEQRCEFHISESSRHGSRTLDEECVPGLSGASGAYNMSWIRMPSSDKGIPEGLGLESIGSKSSKLIAPTNQKCSFSSSPANGDTINECAASPAEEKAVGVSAASLPYGKDSSAKSKESVEEHNEQFEGIPLGTVNIVNISSSLHRMPGATDDCRLRTASTSEQTPSRKTMNGALRQDSGGEISISAKKGTTTMAGPQIEEASKEDRTSPAQANAMESNEGVKDDDDYDYILSPGKSSFRMKRDEEVWELLNEGERLFSQGKSGLTGEVKVGDAETFLFRASEKFEKAAAINPSSIEAFGLWGNTLLVHGELKLKVSRELQRRLSYLQMPEKKTDREYLERSNWNAMQQKFQYICDECEQLLIQAGRKYKMALFMDKNDIRSLYNWGLALNFRAQLIAGDVGQDAMEAADKLYMAAIDKFEAMMGRSPRAAPSVISALLNWGLMLRSRSKLQPIFSEERRELLQQAKQLLEDAAGLHPSDPQIREALSTCSIELRQLQELNEFQRQ